MMNLVRVILKNLTKRFGNVIAVNNVSIEVNDKHFLVLLGPSGCGKTTTLRCIAGLESPDEGHIYIGDTLVNDLPPRDRNIAMVFQSYALYPHMSVFNNITFPLKIHKVPESEIKRRAKHVAELLGIKNLLDRKPKQLSGGEAQRVALGRAIIRDPQVFLMDEPLSNLDARLRIRMRAELKRLQKKLGVTTIYVTHDQVEAMTMADEIAVMNLGTLQQLGDVHEIFDQPTNMLVAGFVGSPPMNFINCTFTEKNGLCFLDAGTFMLPIPDGIGKIVKKNATSSELILGVRPTDILLGNKRTSEKLIEAKVYITEPLGSRVIVNLEVGDNLVRVIATKFMSGVGEKVWIGFNREKMHLFDKKTKNSII